MAFIIVFAFVLPVASQADYGLHAGTHFGFGNMGDDSTGALEKRTLGTFDVQLFPGLRLMGKSLLAGLMFDFRFMSQLSSKSTSLGGNGFLTGPAVGYENPMLKFIFAWDWRARHSASEPSATYKGSGIHLLFGYRISGPLSADLEFVSMKYKTVSANDVETDLTDPVSHKNIGFGVSYSY